MFVFFISIKKKQKDKKIQIYNSNTKRAKFNLYIISIEVNTFRDSNPLQCRIG